MRIPPIDRARIRVVSLCDDGTIKRYPRVSEASKARIEKAAAELGITLPSLSQAGSDSLTPPSRPAAR